MSTSDTLTVRRSRDFSRAVALLAVVSVFTVLASLALGSRTIPIGDLVAAATGHGSDDVHSIFWELRLPRTLLAYAVGACLAIAGVLAQAWTRNPLADPGFIGITAGAAFAVAVGSVTGAVVGLTSATVCAFIGAAAASLLVLTIARRSASPLTLILVGAGIDASLRAGSVLIGLFDSSVLDGMRHWTVGSTFGRSYEDAAVAWAGLAVGAVITALAARPLDLLAMGEETSLALGGSTRRARVLAALGVVVLAGTATATAGPVVFVGFAAPHILRRFLGPQVSRLLLPAALFGGVLVLLADIIGRLIMQPGELEMSIVIAVIGGPVLIAAVRRGAGKKVGE
ncbi:iron ABC transporter permease [Corynebacterium sp. P3-F1]|uniref:FecCD family ABC transporter permease n=1 Tax=Corynebacterium sp. P3-F1 TaxID=3059080 RepID=UPI00265C96F8|nr:iron ABC transporter permease [Corynebacterium sp. P3-F1]WKK60876.1 iron ABC transporter permease [Corynebacterium sp. P3-F1]